MKLLHTSDWHLGQNFMGKSRTKEHTAFLGWLLETICDQEIEVLVIAGDIFDTGSPPNYALELYYNFLTSLGASPCHSVIIIAGNHDSIATLKAPQQLLKALNIHVITSGDESENQIVEIYRQEEVQAIVCAVPFLRDSVVRGSLEGQTMSDKESALNSGIKAHYLHLYQEANALRGTRNIPLIATGHLTMVGSQSSESEREIYIGGTLNIEADFLSPYFDYVALGHLHLNQKVAQKEHIRYSGSPLPLSFSEATRTKQINIVTFDPLLESVECVEIPLTQKLLVLRGDRQSVSEALEQIEDKTTWIEIHLIDPNPSASNQHLREQAQTLGLTVLAIKIDKTIEALHAYDVEVLSLDELSPLEVFEKRLAQDDLKDEKLKTLLREHFKTIMEEVTLK